MPILANTGVNTPAQPMHVSELKNQRGILGDVFCTNYAVNGSAWGITGQQFQSGCGIFVNDIGQTIVITTDQKDSGVTIHQQLNNQTGQNKGIEVVNFTGTYGKDSNIFHAYEDSENDAERFLLALPEIAAGTWRGIDKSKKIINWHYNDPEKERASNFAAILGLAASSAILIGIPAGIVNTAKKVVQDTTTGKIGLEDLADLAAIVAPANVREQLQKGRTLYGQVQSGNYMAAAQSLGIQYPELIQKFKDTTDWTQIAKSAGSSFETVLKPLQNLLNMDAVNALRGNSLSGQLVQDIIGSGTITNVKTFQDAILAGVTPDSVMTLLPNIPGTVASIIEYTNDAVDPKEIKAWLGFAGGFPSAPDALDRLGINAISQRVVSVLSTATDKARQFALSPSIPETKRAYYASEIAKNTGAQILTTTGSEGVVNQFKKALPYIAIGGAAFGAAYFYNKGKS